MWWIPVVGLLATMAVLAIAACLSGPHPQHAAPRHLAVVPPPEKWNPAGSMILAEELAHSSDPFMLRPLLQEREAFLAVPVDPEPWRARIEDELSPEALDVPHEDWVPGPYGLVHPAKVDQLYPDDPGAGDADVVSSAPAPDPDWLEAQMAILFDWVRSVHAGATA